MVQDMLLATFTDRIWQGSSVYSCKTWTATCPATIQQSQCVT